MRQQQHSSDSLGPADCPILLHARAANIARPLRQVPSRRLVLLRLWVPLLAKPTCARTGHTVVLPAALLTNRYSSGDQQDAAAAATTHLRAPLQQGRLSLLAQGAGHNQG